MLKSPLSFPSNPSVAEIALDRLFDKAAAVRRSALSLLTALLENNPFAATMDHVVFEQQRAVVELRLRERVEILRSSSASALALIAGGAKGGEEEEGGESTEGQDGVKIESSAAVGKGKGKGKKQQQAAAEKEEEEEEEEDNEDEDASGDEEEDDEAEQEAAALAAAAGEDPFLRSPDVMGDRCVNV